MAGNKVVIHSWGRASAYRDNTYHAAVDTNNGVESQNKVLKHIYLRRVKGDKTLSSIVCIILKRYLPAQHHEYVFKQYRCYSADVPAFLHNRPTSTIKRCLTNMESAEHIEESDVHPTDSEIGIFQVKGIGDNTNMESAEAIEESDVHPTDSDIGIFQVKGIGDNTYHLTFGDKTTCPSCSCYSFSRTTIPC